MKRPSWKSHFAMFFLCAGCLAVEQTCHAVEYANIDIADGADPINDTPTVTFPAGQKTTGYNLGVDAPITGLFPVSFSGDPTNDSTNGVLLGYVRETGRDELVAGGGSSETLYATAATSRRPDNSYSLVTRRAGFMDIAGPSLYAEHAAFNANIASAYFPFSEGWLAGSVYNAMNNGPLVEMVASPGITLINNFQQDFFGTGDHVLTLPGVTDGRRQGLLFVNGAKNEGNYALSEPTADGSGFTITGHDNASSGSAGELDPVSFVFMPLGTPNVTMARIFARGHGPTQAPVAMIKSGDNFSITRENPGEYRLSIPGQTPASGTLLVSPSGANDGNNGRNSDNIVTYKADGNDWIILSQDLSDTVELSGTGQESGGGAESYFSFAFMPFSSPITAPGPIPAVNTLTNFNKNRVIGWNAAVTQITDGNSPGNMHISELEQTTDVNIVSLFENKGDNNFAVDGAFLAATEGVMFATVSEGLRDNTSTGGKLDYGVVGVSQTTDDEWRVHTGQADSGLTTGNEEFNVNFSVAFFGANSGFEIGQRVPTVAGVLDVTIAGVNALTDGVLMTASNAGNQANFVTANPRADGSGWDLLNNDNNTLPEEEEVNYVYLPYDAENLVAGRVDADGTIAASTDIGDFTLTKSSDGTYLLTVSGKTPSDGMLLLTSTGEGTSSDNSLAYEPAGNAFRILGLDMITEDESDNQGLFVDLEDTSFMFAYIDFDAPPQLLGATDGDFDNDGDVDGADFLLWQRGGSPNGPTAGDLAVWQSDYGTSPSASAVTVVPEPGSIMLLGLALAAGILLGFIPSYRSIHRN